MPRARQLRVVREREGNTQKKPIPEGVRLPPGSPSEPSWLEPFSVVKVGRKPGKAPPAPPRPGKDADDLVKAAYAQARLAWMIELYDHRAELRAWEDRKRLQAESIRCRAIARAAWRGVVPLLDSQGILSQIDAGALADYCVLVARIDQAERDLTQRGTWVEGERGAVKNPSATFVNQCREKLRAYISDFGLSPLARDKLNPREAGGGEGDQDFD